MSEEAKAAMSDAIKDGSMWVLKPQREGGGNNLYGKELSRFLENNVAELGGKRACKLSYYLHELFVNISYINLFASLSID